MCQGGAHIVLPPHCTSARDQLGEGDTAEFVLLDLHDFPYMLTLSICYQFSSLHVEHDDISISWLK